MRDRKRVVSRPRGTVTKKKKVQRKKLNKRGKQRRQKHTPIRHEKKITIGPGVLEKNPKKCLGKRDESQHGFQKKNRFLQGKRRERKKRKAEHQGGGGGE